MKKIFAIVLVMTMCVNGLGIHAQELYSEERARTFLVHEGILDTSDNAQVSYVRIGGEYAIQTVQVLEENQYESSVTTAYRMTEDGQLVRADIRPLSDVSGTFDEQYGIYITAKLSYSLYERYYNATPRSITYVSPYALSVTITGPSDLSISYMEARLAATAHAYPFPDCLDFDRNTDTTQYIIDGMGYYELTFSRSNLTPGLAYGATKFLPSNVILGFSNYGDHDLIEAVIQLNTNKGNISRAEIDFGYAMKLPGT